MYLCNYSIFPTKLLSSPNLTVASFHGSLSVAQILPTKETVSYNPYTNTPVPRTMPS